MGRGARKPKGFRDIDGILLLDKPKGISSNQALQRVRHLFKANKAGHTGSLDPLATGLLPICFGEATKFSSYLLDASKSYRATCQLGQTSSTGDAEGEITTQQSAVNISEAELLDVLTTFKGVVEQIPPMHSAVKVQGQRLYKLARQGKEIERKVRVIEIQSLELICFDQDRFEIDVRCSKGTYIRTLAEDIGAALGCGAYLADLRRTGVHPFWQCASYTLDQVSDMAESSADELDSTLLPIKMALVDLEDLIVDAVMSEDLKQGRVIQVDSAPRPGLLNIIGENGQFIGIGEASETGQVLPKRLMNTAR